MVEAIQRLKVDELHGLQNSIKNLQKAISWTQELLKEESLKDFPHEEKVRMYTKFLERNGKEYNVLKSYYDMKQKELYFYLYALANI